MSRKLAVAHYKNNPTYVLLRFLIDSRLFEALATKCCDFMCLFTRVRKHFNIGKLRKWGRNQRAR